MSKLEDEIYTSHKVEYITLIMAGAIIGFLWKFFPEILPFAESIELPKLYLLKVVVTLLIMLAALCSYIFYLRKIPKYNELKQRDHEDLVIRKLGGYVLDEVARLKAEQEALIKRPPPSSPEVFSQYKEDSRFLAGQEEALLRFSSKWLKPPE